MTQFWEMYKLKNESTEHLQIIDSSHENYLFAG